MRKLFLLFIFLGLGVFLSAQTLEPGVGGTLTDLTPDGVSVKNQIPQKGDDGKTLVVLGDKLLFIGADAANGEEMWITDGTPEGTMLLKDINPGAESSNPNSVRLSGDKVYFSATTADAGAELWVTDGTAEGTMMIEDLYIGANGSDPKMTTAFKGGVLFRAKDIVSEAFEEEWLYWTDGTSITKVAEITPRTDGDSRMSQMQVVHSGEKAFFVGQDKVYGHEMWVTDGTAEGTHMVLDIGFADDPDNTNEGATVSTKIENHFAVNDEQVIFRAETPAWWVELEGTYESIGEEFWVTDGTADGTYPLGDFNQAVGDDVTRTNGTQQANAFLYLSDVYMRADDGIHNVELCKTPDLAPNSVVNVLNTNGPNPDNGDEWPTWVEQHVVWDSLFYFFCNNGAPTEQVPVVTNHEMYVYDGRTDTVYCLYDAWGSEDGLQASWGKPEPNGVNRRLYFVGKADQGLSDKAIYYIDDRITDPTHTPVKLFNGSGDETQYIHTGFNDNVIIISRDGEDAKMYIYDDGETKDPITEHGISGPPIYPSPGNRMSGVGIENNTAMNYSLFPNPVADQLTITMDMDRASTLIVNNAGQVVWSGEVRNNHPVDLSELAPGTYVMMIKTNSGITPAKFVISR